MAGRILIAETIANHRIALRATLVSARYEVTAVSDGSSLIRAAHDFRPDLILVGEDIALAGDAALMRRLKADPAARPSPVIVFVAGNDAGTRIKVLEAGADDVTRRTASARTLLARLRSHLRAADLVEALGRHEATVQDLGFAEPAPTFTPMSRVALISHDSARAQIWSDLLGARTGHAFSTLAIGEALAEADREISADLFVIEAPLAHPGEALSLVAELRARPRTRHAAIIVVHDSDDPETATMALDLGASDLMEAGFHPDELRLRMQTQLTRKRDGDRLRASVDEGLRLALQDPLTGLFNRRYAMSHAERTGRDPSSDKGYCVIVCDIDRFKSINDTHGHAVGDEVLCAVARRMRDNVRSMDMVARIGGEEFLVFLPDPDPDAAHAAALRLCRTIRDIPVELSDGRAPIRVTASFGVAMAEPGENLDRVIARADAALYEAKAAGRDQVTFASRCAA